MKSLPRERLKKPAMRAMSVVLALLGLLAVVAIGRIAGTREVARILWASAPALVPLVLLELLQLALETRAADAIYPSSPDKARWASTRAAYAAGLLLPGGRAVGEALRAARRGVPTEVAIRGATTLHALYVGGAAITLFAIAPCLEGSLRTLALSGGGWNVLVVLALVVLPRVLAKRPRTAHLDPARIGPAAAWLALSRAAHLVQAFVAVHAMGHTSGAPLEALQLLSASAADAVPAQIGALEGAFSTFADALRATPPEALVLALLLRGSRLATMGALVVYGHTLRVPRTAH